MGNWGRKRRGTGQLEAGVRLDAASSELVHMLWRLWSNPRCSGGDPESMNVAVVPQSYKYRY